MLDRNTAKVVLRDKLYDSYLGTMTKSEIVNIMNYGDILNDLSGESKPLRYFSNYYGGPLLPICPVAFIDSSVSLIISMETDAKEYGIIPIDTNAIRQGFRIIRNAKSEIQDRKLKSLRDK